MLYDKFTWIIDGVGDNIWGGDVCWYTKEKVCRFT